MKKTLIKIKNLKISFKQKRAAPLNIIRGVDLELLEGQIIGLVGESGSGKSVTTKALLNVNDGSKTTFDSFEILGEKYDSFSEVKWGDIRGGKIAYIPQNPMTSMNPSRTIKKHIFDVLGYYKKDLKTKEEKKEFAIKILERVKIVNPERVLTSYPHELSGGMKQRVIIAMSILAEAKVIIADEPTTALDPIVQASVLELLSEIAKEYKLSIIFISHNIAVVAKLCDYIYVMYAGKVLEKGTKKEIFTEPKHPYTWALIASIPEGKNSEKGLYTIPGSPPDMANLPLGDPFAPRNPFAVAIDFKEEPPLFEVKGTHFAATWTLHPMYPKFTIPENTKIRLKELSKVLKNAK